MNSISKDILAFIQRKLNESELKHILKKRKQEQSDQQSENQVKERVKNE